MGHRRARVLKRVIYHPVCGVGSLFTRDGRDQQLRLRKEHLTIPVKQGAAQCAAIVREPQHAQFGRDVPAGSIALRRLL